MFHPRILFRSLALALLVIAAQPQVVALAAPASSQSDDNPADADADDAARSDLFQRLQDVIGTSVTDSSGDQGTISDLVVIRGSQYQTPGIFSDVAVKFPQVNGGTTYLVPNSYFTLPPHKLALTIDRSALTRLPVLTGKSLPSAITSVHPGAALASTLMGAKVTSSSGQTLGTVQHILINLPHTTIDYFEVAQSAGLPQPLYAVPAGDTASFSSGTLPLTISAKQFSNLMGFSSGNAPVESGLTNFKFKPSGLYPVASHTSMVNALVLSMHEEAHANLSYKAFANVARSNGQPVVADVFDTVAKVELNDHFHTDGAMSGKLQSTMDNLKTSITTEQQTISTYQTYAHTAQQAGYGSVASMYDSLVQLEQGQLSTLQQALSDVQGGQQPTSSSLPMSLPQAPPVQTMPGTPQAEGQTLSQLKQANKVAAYEYALYGMYARMAASQAYPFVAAMFRDMSIAESKHAVPMISNLAGSVSPDVWQNVAKTVGAERNAHNRYVSQSQLAEGLGQTGIAQQLFENGYMEQHHGDAFQALLNAKGSD